MPGTITCDAANRHLNIGTGYIEMVPPEVWAYEVSDKQVPTQWFSDRGRDRSRPIIGDPATTIAAGGDIQPAGGSPKTPMMHRRLCGDAFDRSE